MPPRSEEGETPTKRDPLWQQASCSSETASLEENFGSLQLEETNVAHPPPLQSSSFAEAAAEPRRTTTAEVMRPFREEHSLFRPPPPPPTQTHQSSATAATASSAAAAAFRQPPHRSGRLSAEPWSQPAFAPSSSYGSLSRRRTSAHGATVALTRGCVMSLIDHLIQGPGGTIWSVL